MEEGLFRGMKCAPWARRSARVNRQKATAPMRALPGRPAIVATREDLESSASANLVPAALLLWALSGQPEVLRLARACGACHVVQL